MDAARATPELSVKTGPSAPLCETAKSGLISGLFKAGVSHVTCRPHTFSYTGSYYSPQWFSLWQIANVGVHSCIISKNCQERDCMQENWTNQLSNESKRTLWHNGKKRPDTVESARGGWTVTLATTPRPLSSLLWGLSAPSSHLLPIHNTQNYLLQATISNCRTFQIPWMSTNPCITMRLTNHPPCWCSQTIPTSLPAFLPTTTDRLFPP